MGRPFIMQIIISMHTDIILQWSDSHLVSECPKGIGKTRNLIFYFYY